jgi:phosphate:Na+ symporter
MGEALSIRHTGLLHASNDIERVSDHADNIADRAFISIGDDLRFSSMAIEEIKTMYALVRETYNMAVEALKEGSEDLARQVYAKEQVIDDMEKQLRKSHIGRLKEGICETEAGVVFLDIISNFERVGDHANNLAHVSQGDMGN